ncbi:nucleoside phosphorylase domain-containing protein [Leucosporidium creatinivorum]|uniref:purine-nucleoside phosphorylase n=1 Tax=Leucosporidium creatinivorum TaxID=106004 RepID=A0A1Y2DTW0_9BASI|nr:nucleoside phosphorylase domain-containing protein [Leucosporidium creatinivorum]
MSSPPSQPADLNALPRLADPIPSPSHLPHLDELTASYTQALIDVRSRLPKELRVPKVGIVCGSGLQGLAELLQDRVEVNYAEIEGFGESTVRGHQSALAFGFLGSKRTPVVCQLGRFHAYEGFPLEQVAYPMRIMKLLGISVAIITNAAGGLDPHGEVGTIVALQDHISLPSLTSMNPLIGRNRDTLGPRFPPMSDAYDFDLRLAAFRAAKALGFKKGTLKEGVYAWVAGPTYETKAEQRFLRAAGADVVGMSTVPEVIAARHAGVRVLVLSLVTNIVVNAPYRSAEAAFEAEERGEKGPLSDLKSGGKEEEVASHQEVLDVSAKRADDIRALVEKIVDGLADE